jgi:alpha-beta hydrolase superfamily lysophospholipase
MKAAHFVYPASDGAPLFVHRWLPEGHSSNIRSALHLVHGMAEHGARYEPLARALTRRGIAVYAPDLRGHGRTAAKEEELGHFADHDGWARVVSDQRELLALEREQHQDARVILFGHSMGSLIARSIALADDEMIGGLALSGPNGKVSALVHAGRLIARFERMRLGARGRSKLIDRLSFDSFNRAFAPTRTAFDWLSRDAKAVDRYLADPRCGFLCSTQLWVDLLDAMVQTARLERRTPRRANLPIYIFSGGRDPVNEFGRGAEAMGEIYRRAGVKDVGCRIYVDSRHETLNELDRDEVMADLLAWIEAHR